MNGLYDTNADDRVSSFSPGQYAMVLGIAGSHLSPYFALPRAGLVVLITEQPSLKNYSKSMGIYSLLPSNDQDVTQRKKMHLF